MNDKVKLNATQRKFIQIVTKLDARKFKKLPGKVPDDKGQQLYKNLWSMFDLDPKRLKNKALRLGIKPDKDGRFSVCNFAWTPKVAKAFYAHRKHRAFVKEATRWSFSFGLWKLNAEPSEIEEESGEHRK